MVVLCLDMGLIDAPFLFLRSIISTGGEPTTSLLTRGYQYFAQPKAGLFYKSHIKPRNPQPCN
jgi:hypothetical protein